MCMPAPFDSISNLADAIRMPFYTLAGQVADVHEDNLGEPEDATVHDSNDDSSGMLNPRLSHEEVFSTMQQFRDRCAGTARLLEECQGEEDCARAMMALDTCFGEIVCPTQAKKFSEDPCEETYASLTACISSYREDATAVS